LDLKYIAEITRVKIDKIEYIIPDKKIMKVRSTQISTPHAIGLTFTNKIPIIIIGIAIIANFFHTLNTLSENISANNNDAEIKRGVKK
jgi:hypothetical protein